jgi:flagellar basal-body rod modification protein FlgD
MTSQSISSLTSTSSTTSSLYTTSSSNDEMSKTDFLTLLITQLQNQDPTNPQDSSEFASQLAQFSSLEQLMNLNTSLTSVSTAMSGSQAYSLVGKDALYDGNTLTVTSGETPSDINLALASDASSVTIKIYDSDGTLVRTIDAGELSSGVQSVSWDGNDSSGNALSSGEYTFEVSATDSSGSTVTSAALMREQITGVIDNDGTYYLCTSDGTLLTQDALYAVETHAS